MKPKSVTGAASLNVMRAMKVMLLAMVFAVATDALAQAPGIITYQGRITSNGANFTGTGQFRFVIYKAGQPPVSYWSHDNSSVGAAMPNTALSLAVTNGLFSVGLGDTTLPGAQSQIPPAIFANSDLRLRIWFSDGVVAPAVIADHAITSVGYSLMAMTVPDGSITTAKIFNGNVTTAKIANGAVTSAQLADDITLSNLHLAGTGFGNGTETVTLDAATGAGQGALFTLRNGNGNATWSLDSDTILRGSLMSFFENFGQKTVSIDSNPGGNGGGVIELFDSDGLKHATLDGKGANSGGELVLTDADGTTTVNLRGAETASTGARLDLSQHLGVLTVSLDADANFAGSLVLQDGQAFPTVQLLAATSFGVGAELNMRNGFNHTTVTLDADASGNAGVLALYNNSGSQTVLVDGDQGNGIGGVVQVFNNAGGLRAELDGQGANGGGELVLRDDDGTTTVFIEGAEGAGNGAQIALYKGTGGNPSIVLDADFAGDGRITTQVLEITGGSDFSENFDIRAGDARPGMVVRIDPAHPGELAVSDRAYDRTVAGVVSGAGGVKPGVMMGQRSTAADGKHPVALTGRVYCFVDADRGAIEPGDLITTSDTPGHGMKVDDHARAQGAIIGKAMTPLASGKGLVLVLVSLQ